MYTTSYIYIYTYMLYLYIYITVSMYIYIYITVSMYIYIYIAGFLLFSCTSHRSHRVIPIRFADLSSRAKAAIVRQRPWDRTPQTKPWGNPWEFPQKPP